MHAPLASLASLLALLHPLVSILVVHATDLGVDEDIVGFGDGYKCIMSRVITPKKIS